MPINMSNKNDIVKFINDNIELINTNISEFSKKKHSDILYDAIDIKRKLSEKFKAELDDAKKEALLNEFETKKYIKDKVAEIAINNGYYHKDLEMFYQKEFLSKLETIADKKLSKNVISTILNSTNYSNDKEKIY